jgi:uncharacterized protein (TIGR03000 family)
VYTLVLMTAMSTAPATPQFDGYFRDLFRGSCHGSCTGRDSRSSCQGSSCCGGGLFHGRVRNFFADLFDGGSCQGSCTGSCNGRSRDRDPLPAARPYDRPYDRDPGYGYARGGGCTGSAPIAYGGCTGSCMGSTPLYLGSCFGSTPNYSCFGSSCTGGTVMPSLSVPGYADGCDCGPGGSSGLPPIGGSVPGGFVPGLPGLGTPVTPDYPTIPSPRVPMPGDFDNPAQPRPADGRGGSAFKVPVDDDASRGRVLVRLPADAKLFVEGKQLSVTNGERTFVTPPLPTDREAVYTFKVEYTRDGDTVSHSRKVKVKANATTAVDFADLTGTPVKSTEKGEPVKSLPPVLSLPPVPTETVKTPAAAAAPEFDSRTTTKPKADDVPTVVPPPGLNVAKITVKLPKGATLFVNGGKNERSELVREFTTPTLTPGKAYQYTMRAELTRNGLPEYQESKVDFRAGDALTVDFTSLADAPADRRAAK